MRSRGWLFLCNRMKNIRCVLFHKVQWEFIWISAPLSLSCSALAPQLINQNYAKAEALAQSYAAHFQALFLSFIYLFFLYLKLWLPKGKQTVWVLWESYPKMLESFRILNCGYQGFNIPLKEWLQIIWDPRRILSLWDKQTPLLEMQSKPSLLKILATCNQTIAHSEGTVKSTCWLAVWVSSG